MFFTFLLRLVSLIGISVGRDQMPRGGVGNVVLVEIQRVKKVKL